MKTSTLKTATKNLIISLMCVSTTIANAQAVNEITTDYNGYWKSSATAQNPVKPDNDYNLLAFKFNGTNYSTGVNDAVLTSHAQTFVPGNFRALPIQNMAAANSNTKIGLGAMKDGVYNGPGAVAPSRSLAQYLNDGPNGLNLGTCVANLPAGAIYFSVGNIITANIGDNVPDMLITQVAEPDASNFDRYEFVDINGNRVGNSLDIVLNNIAPVGKWVADFYAATGSEILNAGLTQTQRDIRLWAADFSAFGINASNVGRIAYFKINLSGNSDLAFVAYNATTISLNSTLSLPANANKVTRETASGSDSKNVKVYPNPATGSFTVSHDVARDNEQVNVYNMQGVLLAKGNVTKGSKQTSLNISTLKAGAYQVVYTNGSDRSSQMLIVK